MRYDENENYQRLVAEKMGITWEQYAARATEGIRMNAGPADGRYGDWPEGLLPIRIRYKWFGLPPEYVADTAVESVLKWDRAYFPKLIEVPRADARVRIFPEVPEAGNTTYVAAPAGLDADVTRLSVAFKRWRCVAAIWARRTTSGIRFGMDFVSQRRGSHWRQLTIAQS